MKGVVFVKFNEFVESLFGEEFWDELLCNVELKSNGIYTAVGTYDDQELFLLIAAIEKRKGLSAQDAQFAFGKWMFNQLLQAAPKEAHDFKDVFEFLHAVQNFIHVEVKKLNPDAILPEFRFLSETDNRLSFQYLSPRQLCFFCEGLIHGLAEHTGQTISVSQSECEHRSGQRCVIDVEKL